MKKLVVLGAGAFAAASVALLSSGVATSEPDVNVYNVVGEPYAKAVQILKNQGIKPTFGGSFGSALPQNACLVDSQKVNSSGKMFLMLDCTEEAKAELAESSVPGGPTVGSNGVTTVTPTPVGPQPGMPIPAG